MPSYFPKHTVELRFEEPRAFRRLSFSLVEMALVAGFLLRIFRSFALTHGSNSWWYLGGSFAVACVLLLGMATAHLANYPMHQWVWRAPLFAAVEAVGEMATSAMLIWAGREPNGTVRAEWSDWRSMAAGTLLSRAIVIVLWASLLATIIFLVRRSGVAEDDDEPVVHGAG